MDAKKIRRELRKHQTDAEATLWFCLRNRKLYNFKFRRQHSIDKFIVDFICVEKQLVIELDGSSHNDIGQVNYDFQRDEKIKQLGYNIIRFQNTEVFEQLERVLLEIESNLDTSS